MGRPPYAAQLVAGKRYWRGVCMAVVASILLWIFAISVLPTVPLPAFGASFLEHVASNAPGGNSGCYVNAIQQRWASQAKVQEEADKVRMSRGETDVVNYAIKQLASECPAPVTK